MKHLSLLLLILTAASQVFSESAHSHDHKCDGRFDAFAKKILGPKPALRGAEFELTPAVEYYGINKITDGSALHVAAYCQNLPVIKILVEKYELDVDEHRNGDNITPLRLAIENSDKEEETLEIVKYLVEEAGANIHAQDSKKNQAIDAAGGIVYDYLYPKMEFRHDQNTGTNIWAHKHQQFAEFEIPVLNYVPKSNLNAGKEL